jgi:hypothetical protein
MASKKRLSHSEVNTHGARLSSGDEKLKSVSLQLFPLAMERF